ncbi:hypothetical protein SAMN05443663_103395 [Flavobacterium defluvii]|uniref:Uncharacterized protein n=1 Tax=Flavobacterium defluvii TaxID=370979 RepID=A0A1M5LKM8_9FLAO|nr:hypothetical protein SAMN05443663_103395 [Flavobacterium defluvii]
MTRLLKTFGKDHNLDELPPALAGGIKKIFAKMALA